MIRAGWPSRLFVTGVGVLAVVAVTAAPAAAKIPTQKGSGFAGYQVQKTGKVHVTKASATFVIPTITCKKNLSGAGPSVLISSTVSHKTGTFTYAAGGVGVACEHKTPIYESIVTIGGKPPWNDFQLSAGDTVSISVTMAHDKSTVSVIDSTDNQQSVHTGKTGVGETAQIGDRSLVVGSLKVGADSISKTAVTKAAVNGKSLTGQKPTRFTWVHKGVALATTGPLSKGQDFTVTFHI